MTCDDERTTEIHTSWSSGVETLGRDTELTICASGQLSISPFTEELQPIGSLGRLESSTLTGSARAGECLCGNIVVVATIVLCDIPICSFVGGIVKDTKGHIGLVILFARSLEAWY